MAKSMMGTVGGFISGAIYAVRCFTFTVIGAVLFSAFTTCRFFLSWTIVHVMSEMLTNIASFDVKSIVYFASGKSNCHLVFINLESFT